MQNHYQNGRKYQIWLNSNVHWILFKPLKKRIEITTSRINANKRFIAQQSKRWWILVLKLFNNRLCNSTTNQPASTDHHEQQKYQSEYIVCTVCSLWSTSSNCKQTMTPMIAMQPSFRASPNVLCCIIDRSLSNWPMPQCRSCLHFHKKPFFQWWFLLH